jgi:hypothetical protein
MSDSCRSLVVCVKGRQYVERIKAKQKAKAKAKQSRGSSRGGGSSSYGNLVCSDYLGTDVLFFQRGGRITRETVVYSELVACDAQHTDSSSR